ncbi:hypothetical protein EYF80_005095 [Liparis tanakae]|uniref:Uncharacterized protein n=1 Tax=Liparis tanakae TaxID=230148 RepID=A0A4Z2J395_9TELE|nr:hypothetical protein EYF80_005095 [Liparis tanakae]
MGPLPTSVSQGSEAKRASGRRLADSSIGQQENQRIHGTTARRQATFGLAVAKWQLRSFVPTRNAPDVPALAINGSQTSQGHCNVIKHNANPMWRPKQGRRERKSCEAAEGVVRTSHTANLMNGPNPSITEGDPVLKSMANKQLEGIIVRPASATICTASHQSEGVTGANVCSLDDTVRRDPDTLGTRWKCGEGTEHCRALTVSVGIATSEHRSTTCVQPKKHNKHEIPCV